MGKGVDHLAYTSSLRRGHATSWNLHPQHEGVATLALWVETHPLEPFHLAWNTRYGSGSFDRVTVPDRSRYLERVAFELPAFDLVQLAAFAGGSNELQGSPPGWLGYYT
jgi:hypothetical protein